VFGLEFFHVDAGDDSAVTDEQNFVTKQGLERTAARFAGDHFFDAVLDRLKTRQRAYFVDIGDGVRDNRRRWVEQVRHLRL
jgi:hypothetical protein